MGWSEPASIYFQSHDTRHVLYLVILYDDIRCVLYLVLLYDDIRCVLYLVLLYGDIRCVLYLVLLYADIPFNGGVSGHTGIPGEEEAKGFDQR